MEHERDSAIFDMLAWSLASKGQILDHILPLNPKTSEMAFGKVNSDSAIAVFQFVRILPFDRRITSRTAWRGVVTDFGSANTGLVRCAPQFW